MKAFLALVAFEIRERKALILAAAVASVLPVLAPILGGTGSNTAADIREVAMWVMVGCLVPLFALLIGVAFVGRDLAEGRMGFYYSQPLSGPTIWFGKWTAVVVLVWGVQLLIMLPTALLSPDSAYVLSATWLFDYPRLEWLAPVVLWGTPVAIVLVSHALGIVWRGRSAWLVVDLIAVLAVLGGAWFALRPFLPDIAPIAAFFGGLWIVPWALAGLLAGGAIQVTVGRVDLRRSHRALSAAMWPILLAAVAMCAVWSWWVRSASPEDLYRIEDVAVGSGEWIAVVGESQGRFDYRPRFLINTADGRWIAAGTGERWYHGSNLAFSAEMSRALWAVPEGRDDWTVMTVDLEVRNPQPRSTGVVVNQRIDDLAVSADGSRFVAIQRRTVSVYDVESGEQLAATQFDGKFLPQWSVFDSSSTVRIEARTPWNSGRDDWDYKTFHLDIESRRLSDDGTTRKQWKQWVIEADDTPKRRLVEASIGADEHLMVIDDRTAERIADLGAMPHWQDIRLIGDGRIMVVRDQNDEHHLEIFDVDGHALSRIELENPGQIYVGGEVAPGRFAVGLVSWGSGNESGRAYRTAVVDLPSATVVFRLDGFRPLLGLWGVTSSYGAWNEGAVATRLLIGEDETLHLWNPNTGEVRPLVPGGD